MRSTATGVASAFGSSSLLMSATNGGEIESCAMSATKRSAASSCGREIPVTRRVRSSTPSTSVPPLALANAASSSAS